MLTAETWYLSSADRGRRRLFPRGIVGLFALSLLLVGWLALPSKSLHERLANAHETDLLTVVYLNAWLNATPKNWSLRLTLARHQALIGHHREALRSIDLILGGAPAGAKAASLRLRLNILERMAFELPENNPRRASLLARVRYELERIALTATDPIEMEAYLRRAEKLEHPSLVAKLLARLPEAIAKRILAGNNSMPEEFSRLAGRPVEQLARKAIGLGDFRLAAQLFWQAFDHARDPARRLELLMMVSKAEQAGDRLREFFIAFESRMDLVQLDTAAYKRLARLALAANRLDLAEQFARRMLKFSAWWKHLQLSDTGAVLQGGWQWLISNAGRLSPLGSAHAATPPRQSSQAAIKPTTLRSATMASALARARAKLAAQGLSGTSQQFTNEASSAAVSPAPFEPDKEAPKPEQIAQSKNDPLWPAPQGSGKSKPVQPSAQTDPLASVIKQALARDSARPAPPTRLAAGTPETAIQERLDEALNAARANPSLAGAVPIPQDILTATVITQPPRPVVVAQIDEPKLQSRLLEQTSPWGSAPPLVGAEPDYESAARSPDGQTGALVDTDPNSRYARNFHSLLDTLAELTPEDEDADSSLNIEEYDTASLSKKRLPKSRPQLRFEDESYLLAYQVFLARGNLNDAYAVADSATRQSPDNLTWRKRLAQVSEWSQRPIVALDNWLLLARANNSREYWANVKRLAGGLRDEHRTIEFLQWKLKRAPSDYDAVIQISQAHERLGEAGRSIEWLSDYLRRQPKPEPIAVLMELAAVAERNSDPDLLVDTLRRANAVAGATPERAVRIAAAQYRRSRIRDAYQALREAEPLALDSAEYNTESEKSVKYWSTYAELARILREDQQALTAYRQMLALETYEAEHLEAMASVLQTRSHRSAAQVMSHAYYKYNRLQYANRAVNSYLMGQDLPAAEAFLATLPEKDRTEITSSIAFLKQRAAYYQAADEFKLARRDVLSIYKIAPRDIDNRASLIWLLLAEKNARALRAVLGQWEKLARQEEKLWGPFGAALLSLGDAPAALKYFVWQSRGRQDYLWWLAYADALEATGRGDAAWTLRRRAWTELREAPLAKLQENAETRDRIVALAMRFSPADEARQLLTELVRDRDALSVPAPVDRGRSMSPAISPALAASPEAPAALAAVLDYRLRDLRDNPNNLDPIANAARAREVIGMKSTANELAVSYLLSQEAVDSARAWLLSRYAQQLVQPTWARLSVALANHDDQALDTLLATLPDWLPKLDRVEALARIGRTGAAETLAFDALVTDPDSQTAHQKLVDLLMEGGPSAGVLGSTSAQGVVDISRLRVDGALRFDQHGKIWIFGERERTKSTNTEVVNNGSASGETVGIGLQWRRHQGDLSGELSRRDMLAPSTGLKMRWQQSISPFVSYAVTGGLNQPTGELASLSIGGQQDYLRLEGRANLTGRDYLAGLASIGRYQTQLETTVADSRRFSVEYGHRLRLEYPDLTLRAALTNSVFKERNVSDPIIARLAPSGSETPLAGFVPASSSQLDLFVSAGQSAQDSYTKTVRPFGEAGVSFNSNSGWGYSLRGGIGTSILGTDRLMLYGAYTSKSPGNTRGSRELGLSYRLHY